MAPPRITKAKLGDKPKSWLIYGQAGHGKTHLAGSIAQVKGIKKVTIVDFDGSAGVLSEVAPEADIVQFERNDIAGFEAWWKTYCRNGGDGSDATIIDTGTGLQDWKLRSLPKSLGWDRIELATEFVCNILWDLHDLPGVGISLFHTEIGTTVRGADASDTQQVPALQGKSIKFLVPRIPDIIGFLEDDGEDRTLSLRPNDEALSKNRFNKLPDLMSDPDMPKIYDYLSGKRVKKSQ
jgi:hypothetical protein